MVRLPRGQEPDRMTGTPSLCPSRPGPVGRARGTWQEGGIASQPAQNASVHLVLSKRRALVIRDGTPRGRGSVPSPRCSRCIETSQRRLCIPSARNGLQRVPARGQAGVGADPSRPCAPARGPNALVVGAGPNGLAAAITLARAGWSVTVREAAPVVGGGVRSAELTLPGYVHDVCSAIHPLAVASPFFRALPLAPHGLSWIEPPAALAHPFDDGTAAVVERSLAATVVTLGGDAAAYRRLMAPLVDAADTIFATVLGPLRLPRPSVALARFGLAALRSAAGLATAVFAGPRARAVFAGLAAHAALPLESPASAAIALVLGLAAHAVGWPMPRGGAGRLSEALAAHLASLGGIVRTESRVDWVDLVEDGGAVLLDVVPRDARRLCGELLPSAYRRR